MAEEKKTMTQEGKENKVNPNDKKGNETNKGNHSKKNGRKGGNKRQGGHGNKGGQREDRSNETRTGNDVAWYKQGHEAATLFELATSISTYHMAGKPFKIETSVPASYQTGVEHLGPSGVISYNTEISLGTLYSPDDGANRASIALYNTVRGKYSNTIPFQAQDTLCYIGATGSAIACLCDIARILNWVNMYTQDSVILPEALFKSRNFDFYTERKLYAMNKFRLITLISRLNCITILKDLTYYAKLKWAFSFDWYQDYSGTRGNIATLKPTGFWRWDSSVPTVDDPNIYASGLVYNSVVNITSIEQYLDFAENLISALVDNDDVRTISGWLNQYVDSQFMMTGADFINIEPTYPTHNEMVKYQLLNANVGASYPVGSMIQQSVDKQCLLDTSFGEYFFDETDISYSNSRNWMKSWVLNFPTKPDHDLIMEATRFVSIPRDPITTDNPNGSLYITYEHDILHISGVAYTYFRSDNNTFYTSGVENTLHYYSGEMLFQQVIPFIRTLQLQRLIDAYPSVVLADHTTDPMTVQVLVDSDYAFEVSESDLHKLHTTALLSEFYIDLSKVKTR